MRKQTFLIISLFILLVAAVGYIGYIKFEQSQQQKVANAFQEGGSMGYQQAIIEIMQKAVQCQQVPLYAENVTVNLISVDCLQQPSKNTS